jgi:hypothetical protein
LQQATAFDAILRPEKRSLVLEVIDIPVLL